MAPLLSLAAAAAAALLLLASPRASAQENVIAALTQGAKVTIYTPLPDGMLEATSFQPPAPLPRAMAEAAVASARQHLALLEIPR